MKPIYNIYAIYAFNVSLCCYLYRLRFNCCTSIVLLFRRFSYILTVYPFTIYLYAVCRKFVCWIVYCCCCCFLIGCFCVCMCCAPSVCICSDKTWFILSHLQCVFFVWFSVVYDANALLIIDTLPFYHMEFGFFFSSSISLQ